MIDILTTLLNAVNNFNLEGWLAAVTGVVTACTAITALTPTKVDNKIVNGILKALNFLAGNVLKNKNKDDA